MVPSHLGLPGVHRVFWAQGRWVAGNGAHREVPGAVGAGRVVAGEVRRAEDALRLQAALQGQVHLASWAPRTAVTQGPMAPAHRTSQQAKGQLQPHPHSAVKQQSLVVQCDCVALNLSFPICNTGTRLAPTSQGS